MVGRPRSTRPRCPPTTRCVSRPRRRAPGGSPAPGDPEATQEAILRLVDTENPPLRMFLGESPLGIATTDYESRLAAWREWQPVAAAAQGNPGQGNPK
jgi:hypothetical protein